MHQSVWPNTSTTATVSATITTSSAAQVLRSQYCFPPRRCYGTGKQRWRVKDDNNQHRLHFKRFHVELLNFACDLWPPPCSCWMSARARPEMCSWAVFFSMNSARTIAHAPFFTLFCTMFSRLNLNPRHTEDDTFPQVTQSLPDPSPGPDSDLQRKSNHRGFKWLERRMWMLFWQLGRVCNLIWIISDSFKIHCL